ncbi:hypothetical protein M2133_001184 [Parabacteroides sp. PF5-6]|nr:hypothetical protein [Parabacteroides sp. PF5-6]
MAEDHFPQGVSSAIFSFGKVFAYQLVDNVRLAERKVINH